MGGSMLKIRKKGVEIIKNVGKKRHAFLEKKNEKKLKKK